MVRILRWLYIHRVHRIHRIFPLELLLYIHGAFLWRFAYCDTQQHSVEPRCVSGMAESRFAFCKGQTVQPLR